MEVKEILETYSGKNIIRDENLNEELKKLYSLALEYREKNLLTSEMVLTAEEELEKLEERIERLKEIGLGKSTNVRNLEKELADRKEANSKREINEERTNFLASIADDFNRYDMSGFLVISFQDFAKFLAGKGYTHKALSNFEGELNEDDIIAIGNIVDELSCLELSDVINCMRTTHGAGQFKDEVYKYGELISISKIIYENRRIGDDVLKDNQLYFVSKSSYLRPEGIIYVSDLLDNDLYQVRFDDGFPNHDLGNLFDSSISEDDLKVEESKLGTTDLLIAENPKGLNNIVYQTFLDGIIIYYITGYNLKLIDYGTVRVDK